MPRRRQGSQDPRRRRRSQEVKPVTVAQGLSEYHRMPTTSSQRRDNRRRRFQEVTGSRLGEASSHAESPPEEVKGVLFLPPPGLEHLGPPTVGAKLLEQVQLRNEDLLPRNSFCSVGAYLS